MAIEVGAKIPGKVSGITNFGAFVDLGDHKTGLVHISEVSDGFIKDIHDVLKVGDQVNVKVLKVGDDGKIALSMKQANDEHSHTGDKNNSHNRPHNEHHGSSEHKNFHGHGGNNNHFNNHRSEGAANHNNTKSENFDDMMSKFLKQSDSRLATIKKNTEGKRGGRGGRRS
ncbi:S1 domain-containing RNA-binding protein [Lactobacillus sp. Sy-1]|uniref:S1 domain-containing RNA-binding protein n=1 Tax=Lactobacillus sp. Sy-1 TaxID=2109645 RepID=UPI001C597A2B|nr:S1 domain-containing RNA-binding protein [Lactobacillus sp. Sy-1]MBW1604776.1 RNA-binding protein S1 [Lactobacillus sp. Sy-1]